MVNLIAVIHKETGNFGADNFAAEHIVTVKLFLRLFSKKFHFMIYTD